MTTARPVKMRLKKLESEKERAAQESGPPLEEFSFKLQLASEGASGASGTSDSTDWVSCPTLE
jgi:hypothetical protein